MRLFLPLLLCAGTAVAQPLVVRAYGGSPSPSGNSLLRWTWLAAIRKRAEDAAP
jgi:hypothetical protein